MARQRRSEQRSDGGAHGAAGSGDTQPDDALSCDVHQEPPTPEDEALAQTYAEWPEKGSSIDGCRLTIMTRRQTVRVHDAVRIIHVMEATVPGYDLYVMGPKPITDEYVDDVLATETTADVGADPLKPAEYDGRVSASPGIDFNFAVTVYSFRQPGSYDIHWHPAGRISNFLRIEVLA